MSSEKVGMSSPVPKGAESEEDAEGSSPSSSSSSQSSTRTGKGPLRQAWMRSAVFFLSCLSARSVARQVRQDSGQRDICTVLVCQLTSGLCFSNQEKTSILV